MRCMFTIQTLYKLAPGRPLSAISNMQQKPPDTLSLQRWRDLPRSTRHRSDSHTALIKMRTAFTAGSSGKGARPHEYDVGFAARRYCIQLARLYLLVHLRVIPPTHAAGQRASKATQSWTLGGQTRDGERIHRAIRSHVEDKTQA